jgi:hypothetical protein
MSYNAKNFTFGSKTKSQIDVLSSTYTLETGMSVWNSDIKKPEYYTGTVWTNEDCIVMTNVHPSAMVEGNIAGISRGTTINACVLARSGESNFLSGVVYRGGAIGDQIVIAIQGMYKVKFVSTETFSTRGNLVQLSSTFGEGDQVATTAGQGVIGVVTETLASLPVDRLVKCMIQNFSSF